MKIFLLVLATAYIALAVPTLEQIPQHGRFLKFEGPDGKDVEIDLEAEPDMQFVDQFTRSAANNKYCLYTRQNPAVSQELIVFDEESVRNSNFDATKELTVVVHGWLGSEDANTNTEITTALLDGGDINVIVLDWRALAIKDYITAVYGVPSLGVGLGRFLDWLSNLTGAPLSNMHLVGFSLGAHIVGNAGRTLDGKVARITGLDPAGPLWYLNSNKIKSSDAVYVEGIHTDGLILGIGMSIGHVDFFPNGGNSQPGCLTSICNHNRAWKYFASTVVNRHLFGKRCSNAIQMTLGTCRGDELEMGTELLTKTYRSGSYRLSTSRRYPY